MHAFSVYNLKIKFLFPAKFKASASLRVAFEHSLTATVLRRRKGSGSRPIGAHHHRGLFNWQNLRFSMPPDACRSIHRVTDKGVPKQEKSVQFKQRSLHQQMVLESRGIKLVIRSVYSKYVDHP